MRTTLRLVVAVIGLCITNSTVLAQSAQDSDSGTLTTPANASSPPRKGPDHRGLGSIEFISKNGEASPLRKFAIVVDGIPADGGSAIRDLRLSLAEGPHEFEVRATTGESWAQTIFISRLKPKCRVSLKYQAANVRLNRIGELKASLHNCADLSEANNFPQDLGKASPGTRCTRLAVATCRNRKTFWCKIFYPFKAGDCCPR